MQSRVRCTERDFILPLAAWRHGYLVDRLAHRLTILVESIELEDHITAISETLDRAGSNLELQGFLILLDPDIGFKYPAEIGAEPTARFVSREFKPVGGHKLRAEGDRLNVVNRIAKDASLDDRIDLA